MWFGIATRDLHGAKSLARGDNKEAGSDHQKVRFVMLCSRGRASRLDTVSTVRGSGWVSDQDANCD